MKKWLIGCLVTGILLAVLAFAAAYLFIWRPLSAASGGDVMGKISDLKNLGEAEQAVKNKSAFTAPADGKLSPAQVAAFVAVQQTISDKMGADFAVLEEKVKKMNEMESQAAEPNFQDIMGGFADMTKLLSRAKQLQVEGLNAQNMSMEEYRWIRDQVSSALPYLAVDLPTQKADAVPAADAIVINESTVAEMTVEEAIAKAQESAQKAAAEAVQDSIPGGQQMGEIMQGPADEAGRANVELLRPHRELLYKTMTAAWMSM